MAALTSTRQYKPWGNNELSKYSRLFLFLTFFSHSFIYYCLNSSHLSPVLPLKFVIADAEIKIPFAESPELSLLCKGFPSRIKPGDVRIQPCLLPSLPGVSVSLISAFPVHSTSFFSPNLLQTDSVVCYGQWLRLFTFDLINSVSPWFDLRSWTGVQDQTGNFTRPALLRHYFRYTGAS